MKRIAIGIIALAVAAPAMAADFATKAPPAPQIAPARVNDWTGLYLGINGGGGQSHNCWDMTGAFVFNFTPTLSEGCNGGTGAVFGGQIGYRQQVGSWVFGIEAQGDWANLSGSNQSAVFNGINAALAQGEVPVSINLTNTSKVNAIGMFTGQVGYSFGSVLLYAKGGAAVTDNTYSGSLSVTGLQNVPSPLLTDSAKEIKFGGVAGAGLEWMFSPGWSLGAEYNHLFMGSRVVGFGLTNAPLATNGGGTIGLLGNGSPSRRDTISQDIDMATIRLNYSFGH